MAELQTSTWNFQVHSIVTSIRQCLESDIEIIAVSGKTNDCGDVEEFHGAAQTFGKGLTFMDKFHMDQFADKRKSNLYYPFASREEWDLASFLLRSSLSMADIDVFLSLTMVCCKVQGQIVSDDLDARSNLCDCHTLLLRNCEVEPNYCLLVQFGSARIGKPYIPRKPAPTSFTATRLNVSRLFCINPVQPIISIIRRFVFSRLLKS
jgi:hypothetical protein